MSAHFHSFTAEAMKAFRQSLTAESQRRRHFLSELRTRVQKLLGRFEQRRQERAGDLQEMSREARAASDSFHGGAVRPVSRF